MIDSDLKEYACKLRHCLGHDDALNLVEVNKNNSSKDRVSLYFIEASQANVMLLTSELSWIISLRNWDDEEILIKVPVNNDHIAAALEIFAICDHTNLADMAGSEIVIIEKNDEISLMAFFAPNICFDLPVELDEYGKSVLRYRLPFVDLVSHEFKIKGHNSKLSIFSEREFKPVLDVFFKTSDDLASFSPLGLAQHIDVKPGVKFVLERQNALVAFMNRQ